MLATPQSAGVASTSTWKEPVLVANFKQIIAMCLDGASYAQITHALGCSRREVSRAKKVINDEALTPERFRQLPPGLRLPSFSGHPICTDLVSVGEDVHCESTAQEVHAGVPA